MTWRRVMNIRMLKKTFFAMVFLSLSMASDCVDPCSDHEDPAVADKCRDDMRHDLESAKKEWGEVYDSLKRKLNKPKGG